MNEERGYMFADAFQNYISSDLMNREPHEKAKHWGAFEIGPQVSGTSSAAQP